MRGGHGICEPGCVPPIGKLRAGLQGLRVVVYIRCSQLLGPGRSCQLTNKDEKKLLNLRLIVLAGSSLPRASQRLVFPGSFEPCTGRVWLDRCNAMRSDSA